MTRWKRLIYYLVLNVLVSACSMLAVLIVWDKIHQGDNVKPNLAQINLLARTPTITPIISVPTETPAPRATRAMRAYTVRQGETLGEIAMRFDISVDELMNINSISDPNALGAGTVILVPKKLGKQMDHEKALSAGSIPPTVTAAPGEPGSLLVIDRVVGAGDLKSEFVLVRGTGAGEVTLTGWALEDDDGNRFVFPQLTLFKDGAVAVHSASGLNTVVDLYWDLKHPVWDSGDIVVLTDAQGNVRATYRIP